MNNSNNNPGLSKWVDFLGENSYDLDWSFEISTDDVKKYCTHEFVEMGFMHSKLVCRHCDILKEDWEMYLAEQKVKKEEQLNTFRY